jgi:hypothetical protein
VQRALDSLEPGETVYVRAGVYRENLSLTRSGTHTQTATVRSYPGERVVLRPAEEDPSYPLKIKTGAAYVRVQGFVVESASMPSTVPESSSTTRPPESTSSQTSSTTTTSRAGSTTASTTRPRTA